MGFELSNSWLRVNDLIKGYDHSHKETKGRILKPDYLLGAVRLRVFGEVLRIYFKTTFSSCLS
jgi:hypothetical protein